MCTVAHSTCQHWGNEKALLSHDLTWFQTGGIQPAGAGEGMVKGSGFHGYGSVPTNQWARCWRGTKADLIVPGDWVGIHWLHTVLDCFVSQLRRTLTSTSVCVWMFSWKPQADQRQERQDYWQIKQDRARVYLLMMWVFMYIPGGSRADRSAAIRPVWMDLIYAYVGQGVCVCVCVCMSVLLFVQGTKVPCEDK